MQRISKSNKIFEAPILDESNKGMTYSEKTQDINITVSPEFIGDQRSLLGDLFVWAYHVQIDNLSENTVKLVSRHWKIIDEQGSIQKVDGEGVVGLQPQILPHNSFKYSSAVHLNYPSGIMSGHYEMQRENGEKFNIKIPAFSLDSGLSQKSIN